MSTSPYSLDLRRKELVESVGCHILFLPPYSPDLNSIEKFWANIKQWIKNRISNFRELFYAIKQFLP